MTTLKLSLGLFFVVFSDLTFPSCLPMQPNTVELLVDRCILTNHGSTRIEGRARPYRGEENSKEGNLPNDPRTWNQLPMEDFVWHRDSSMQCSAIAPGEVPIVLKHQKCCDVVMIDSMTGQRTRPCDKEPWQISTRD